MAFKLLCCVAVVEALTMMTVDPVGKVPSSKRGREAESKALVQKLKQATTATEVTKLLNVTDVINAFVVSTGMNKLRRLGKYRDALVVFEKAKAGGVALNTFTFNAAISACAKGGEWQKALDLVDELKQQRGLEPDVITYTAAISACAKGGQWLTALELLDELKHRGLEPNIITYSAAISACEKGRQWETGIDIL